MLVCVTYCVTSISDARADDQNGEEWRAHAEADTFFCFSLLMSEIRVSAPSLNSVKSVCHIHTI